MQTINVIIKHIFLTDFNAQSIINIFVSLFSVACYRTHLEARHKSTSGCKKDRKRQLCYLGSASCAVRETCVCLWNSIGHRSLVRVVYSPSM